MLELAVYVACMFEEGLWLTKGIHCRESPYSFWEGIRSTKIFFFADISSYALSGFLSPICERAYTCVLSG
jgi:hypothetical protein